MCAVTCYHADTMTCEKPGVGTEGIQRYANNMLFCIFGGEAAAWVPLADLVDSRGAEQCRIKAFRTGLTSPLAASQPASLTSSSPLLARPTQIPPYLPPCRLPAHLPAHHRPGLLHLRLHHRHLPYSHRLRSHPPSPSPPPELEVGVFLR